MSGGVGGAGASPAPTRSEDQGFSAPATIPGLGIAAFSPGVAVVVPPTKEE